MPPSAAYEVLGTKPRASCLWGEDATDWPIALAPNDLTDFLFSNSGTMTQGCHMLDGCPTTELHLVMLFTEIQHPCTHLYMYVWVSTSKTRSWSGLKLRITFLSQYINAWLTSLQKNCTSCFSRVYFFQIFFLIICIWVLGTCAWVQCLREWSGVGPTWEPNSAPLQEELVFLINSNQAFWRYL